MNIISTGAFLNEMDASNKQPTVAEKFAAVWEKKNAKAARAGGVSLMALSLAACGSSSNDTVNTGSSGVEQTEDDAQSFVLATTIDAITGGSGDDTISGSAGTIDGDIINGGDGTDHLSVTLTNADDNNSTFTVTNVETIDFRVSNGNVVLDMGDTSGADLTARRLSGDLQLDNVEFSAGLTIENTSAGALVDVNFDAASVDGTTDSKSVTVDSNTDVDLDIDSIETLTIAAVGGDTTIGALTGDDLETVNITGSVDVTISSVTGAGNLTVDAAQATGAVDVTLGAGAHTATGGSGADTFTLGTTLTSLDTIDGGDGDDTLELTAAAESFATSTTDGDVTVSGIESLALTTDGDGNDDDAIDFDVFSAPAEITSVTATLAADSDGLTLTDTQASTFTIRNTNAAGDGSDDWGAVEIDLKTSTGTEDAITVNLVNRELDQTMTIAGLTAAGVETLTLSADATDLDSAPAIALTALTMTVLETVNISGDADLTIPAFATTVETVTSTLTGDLDVTFAGADVTLTSGAGDDTLSFGTSLNASDTIVGGDGDDTLEATFGGAVYDDDIEAAGVENLDLTQAAGANAVTLDLRGMDVLDTVIMSADATQGTTTTLDNLVAASFTLTLDAAGHASDVMALALDDDGDADSLTVNLDASYIGAITANDHETISIDFDSATSDQIADLNATDLATLTLTDDVADGTVVDSIEVALDGELTMSIDLTGMGASLGYADSTAATAADYVDETADHAMVGLVAEAASQYTITIADGRVDTDHRMLIDLTDTAGQDTIVFSNTAADTTNDIGLITISNFGDVTAVGSAAATILDLTAFGITSIGDLTFADKDIDTNGTSDAEDILVITATDTDDFAGSIELVGVSVGDLTVANFDFIA